MAFSAWHPKILAQGKVLSTQTAVAAAWVLSAHLQDLSIIKSVMLLS
jgi:hypothetical protein